MPESTATPQQPPTPTPWRDGVIARYLTDAGKALANPKLAVDVHAYRKDGQHTLAKCGVCPWEYDASGNPSLSSHFSDAYCESEANKQAHHAAQAHAERCRALPRPEVS
ncbi:hypothetical protein EASAB2608_06222 [Streptomyces sp. EAS-AB2608]|uniref:hypothetical protein n=1 Tax=Streptomyces sp. EAS-AB2608 TaxID=2779671 RepID=UPI001BEE9BDE|nr:hypothetical protein [Streptomyces sp. EAS-AB2608]BCM70888.1 hypothetical protein EASAB2608_06222 [Streptomyces sp. EAS-AB2608]